MLQFPQVPLLPQCDPRPERRLAKIAKARAAYRINFDYEGLGFVEDVPWNEKYNPNWIARASFLAGEMKLNQAISRLTSLGPDSLTATVVDKLSRFFHEYEVFERPVFVPEKPGKKETVEARKPMSPADYLNLFKIIKPPAAIAHFAEDWWFAYERIAGCNPVKIERVREHLPENLKISQAQYQSVMAELGAPNDTIEKAITDKRLYICDYQILEGLPTNDGGIHHDRQFVQAPILLLARAEGQSNQWLMPVAIQMGQKCTDETPLVLRKFKDNAWDLAKVAVQVADSVHHGIVMHNVYCHYSLGLIAISSRRTLAPAHPVMILLEPHLECTLLVNSLTKGLIEPGGMTIELQGTTAEGTVELMKRALKTYDWNDTGPEAELAKRGVLEVDELPEYPFRDDAMMILKQIKKFVHHYIELYYPDDSSVVDDNEVQAWLKELQSPTGGQFKGMGKTEEGQECGVVKTKSDLVKLLVQIVYRATVYHTAINYSVFDAMGFPPNMPASGYAEGPKTNAGEDELEHYSLEDLHRMYPPLAKSEEQMFDVHLVSNLRINYLGKYRPWHFRDKRVWNVVKEFEKGLQDVEVLINNLNQYRPAPYKILLPSKIPNSIFV